MTDRLELPRRYRDQLEALLREHVPGVEVWAYGSRVNGGSHEGSDLDLVLRGPSLEPLDGGFYDLLEAIEKSNIPILVQAHDWAMLPESFHREIERGCVVVQEGAKQTAASGWREIRLGDVMSFANGTSSPERSADSLYPVYGSNGIIGKSNEVNADANTIVIGRVGSYCGSLHFSNENCWITDNAIRAKAVGENDSKFFLYLLQSLGLNEWRSGSGQPLLNQRILSSIPTALPPLPTQRAIAHLLGTLDDKIELNRRMNETLEEIARALFKSWFVDFDPVRAKMAGRWRRGESLPGLPADLYDLFPDRLVDSDLGEIPEGWGVGVLDDVIELLSGGTPKTSVSGYWGGDIPWYTAKDAPNRSDVFVLDTERTITQSGVENSATRILAAGTTVITARGTVGRLACLGAPMAMNQTCYGIRGAYAYPDFFTYWNLRTAVDELQTRTHGTIFDTITRQTFTLVEMALAPVDLTLAFEAIVEPIMAHILNNLKESRSLAAQRDVLLPGLVSGEVGVVAFS